MCGIIALFSPSGGVNEEALVQGTRAMKHRGPDGEKVWLSAKKNAGLGHRRLSIIDPVGGVQPIVNKEGSIAVVVNGELYGYKKIRADLEARGYVFQTKSDSEIVLGLYQVYGSEFMQYLRGEFAFIIYDDIKKRVIAGRDRFGIKPLQYAVDSLGNIYLASEAKAIFAAGYKPQWDRYSLYHSFTLQYLPQDRTLFEGVKQLKPGHVLTYDTKGLSIQKYWDLDFPLEQARNEDNYNEADLTNELERQLIEAVTLRLQTDDAKYCCHLSGGVDSAMIAAIAARVGKQKMHSFTVSFPHQSYDEAGLAEKHASFIGSDFTRVIVSPVEIIEALSDSLFYSEGNAINSHIAAKYILNKAVRDAGFKIALTGEGSDEALGGYIHQKADLMGEIPEESRNAGNVVAGVHLPMGESLDLGVIKDRLGYMPAFLQAKGSIGLAMHSVLTDEFRAEYSSGQIFSDLMNSVDVAGQLRGRSRMDQSSYLWTKLTLANYILKTLGDGTEMANSIEGRVPFLDHVFFEFAKSLPTSLKIKDGVQKYILRKIAEKYVIKDIYDKPKQAFMAPPLSLMSDKSGIDFVHDQFSSKYFSDLGLFNQAKVLKLLSSISSMSMSQQVAVEPTIMLMLTTSMIGQRFGI